MEQTDEQKAAIKEISELMSELSNEQILLLGISIVAGLLYVMPKDKRPNTLLSICTEINNSIATLEKINK